MAFTVLITPRHFADDPGPLDYLREHGCELVDSAYGGDRDDRLISEEEAIHLLQGVDALIAGGVKVTRKVLESADRLKIVARRGVGFDTVDLQAATDCGVVVTTTPGALTHSVADFTFGLMLSIARHIHRADRAVREGQWPVLMGTDVWNKTLGIIGLGRIGKGVAQRARGFAMRILAYDVVQDEAFAREFGVQYVSLEELLRQADFVSINAPLSTHTSHIINAEALSLMKPTAFLINTARGGLVDQQALFHALRDRSIAGAGLDVFEQEPLSDSPLRQLDNVVLTSHQAGYSLESMRASGMIAAQNVVRVLQGDRPDPVCVVNPEVYEKGVR
jgi:D-3-phosphoglycerate dehydrogenase